MNEKELASLVEEMREEFQIPPYYEDKQLANLAKEGEHAVGRLNPGCSIIKDLTYRMLLKNYMYYAYHHRVHGQLFQYDLNLADGDGGGCRWQCLSIQTES